MNVNFEYYKVFYHVCAHGSLTAAAQELCISQPAVSQAVRQLEKEAGTKLFFRTSKGVQLTREGELLYHYVKPGVEELLEGGNRLVYDKVMLVMDTVGLGVFTVMGVDKGISQGYMERTFFLVFLGTVTGVGGGLIRDMMAGVPPYIFVRHIYACASIVGAIACVWIYRLWGGVPAMVIGTVVVILIRYLAAHYRWNLPRLRRE